MKDHVIEILVKGTPPKLSYSDGGETRMRSGARVQWVCETHDYGIRFETNASPFDESTIPSSSSAGAETKHTKWFTAKKQERQVVGFKYTVSVNIGDGSTLVDDPIIIVDDEGGT